MNYRHAFHAGNFADCVKHALLVWLIDALQRKPAPISVLDTHAGAGRYDLEDAASRRTREAEYGIARLLADPPSVLARYVGLVRGTGQPGVEARPLRARRVPQAADGCAPCGPAEATASDGAGIAVGVGSDSQEGKAIRCYPGSPALIRALLRPDDRLVCCELHEADAAALHRLFGRDKQVTVHRRDGWEALRGLLPPQQKRGLVLIDPPYESQDEFVRLVGGLATGYQRFRAGVFAAWYPIKHRAPVRAFHAALQGTGIRDVVAAELWLRTPLDPGRLNGCGLAIVNPPYRFEAEAPAILAALLHRLGSGEAGGGHGVIRLAGE
jgi:23S rRNA (adenine2030-N6)-methyltransferase